MFYDQEPHGVFFLIDNKSFYASCEAVQRGYNPLKVPLVVLSETENTNGGLILATSSEAKRLFGIKANVSRKRDLPKDPRLRIVPPRMNLYIEKNLQINEIFRRFASRDEVWPYSIDESILDMTHSWHLFGDSPREVARKIQVTVRKELGLYTTVGIGDNPVQAKIALDVYAKHTQDLIGEIHYETVPQKIWTIPNLTDVWGIGERTAQHLNRLHIKSMYDLAHYNPYQLKQEMGIIGLQLYATAWGVDRSQLKNKPKVSSSSLGNSQVLPRDYRQQDEIETVIKEIGEQVASRLRNQKKSASCLSLSIGFSYASAEETGKSGFSHSFKIPTSNLNQELASQLILNFRKYWQGEAVRNISVNASRLSVSSGQQLNLFDDIQQQVKKTKIDEVVDKIHKQFGFTKLVYAKSLTKDGTAIERAGLVGGHNGGNSYE